jgi:glycosyltransferase involved in cell wall biosynthesis
MEHVDFGAAHIRAERLFRFASSVATRMLLLSNSISVLLPAYRRTLIEKYRAENVHFRSHGILGARPEPPDFSRRGNPEHRVLAIGHWGTYKRLETLMEAFQSVQRRVPSAKLIVAGANHHTMPGYWESIAEKYRDNPRIDFRGYVPEDEIADLYGSATVLVLPYDSSTGSSGPAHQACQFGLPILSSDLREFLDMANDESMAVEFYKRGDADELADKLVALLRSPEKQRDMAEQNFSAALRMTMPQIIREYLRSFDLQKRTRALTHSRFRRVPRWSTSHSETFRFGGWSPWV